MLIDNTNNGILFTSRRSSTTGGKINKATNEYFEDIYSSAPTGTGYSVPAPLTVPVNSPGNDASVCLSVDGNTMLIYRARWDETTNDWGMAENLGPDVNSAFDEDGIYVAPDGNTIYFSSKGHNTIGGYDVFVSRFENGFWTKAKNMGMPVNSPDDDLYFVLAADGTTGYFSSVRPGGEGQDDIYRVDLSPAAQDTGEKGK